MSNIAATAMSSRRLEYALIGLLGLCGYAMKVPLGMLLHRIMGMSDVHKDVFTTLVGNGAVQIAVVAALASVVHQDTGLPAAPLLERHLYRLHKERKIWVVVPGLLGAVAAMAIVGMMRYAARHFGIDLPLETKLASVSLSHATAVKLALLFPQTALGAGLSEEVLYRFGLLTIFAWLFARLLPTTPRLRLAGLAPAILLQSLFFAYAHVSEGLLQIPAGGLVMQMIVAPQIWTATILGIVYVRYGLEAAVISHTVGDLFRLGVLATVALQHAHP